MSSWKRPRASLTDRLMQSAAIIQFETGDRVAASASLPAEALDKIEGLEADLESAVEVAFKHGATEWTRLNYPDLYVTLMEQSE